MKEQLDEPLLFDEEDARYANWKDRQPLPPPLAHHSLNRITGHGFRAFGKDAERLNLTSSLPLENGGVSASLGVDHNLPCLVRGTQYASDS